MSKLVIIFFLFLLTSLVATKDAFSTQIEWCQASGAVLDFNYGKLNLEIKVNTKESPNCTLRETEFNKLRYYSKPELEIIFREKNYVVDSKCTENIKIDISTSRVSLSPEGASILIFGRSLDEEKEDNIALYLVEGEIICAEEPPIDANPEVKPQ